eukprot:8738139-Prorocentrum_lima.AAC.1
MAVEQLQRTNNSVQKQVEGVSHHQAANIIDIHPSTRLTAQQFSEAWSRLKTELGDDKRLG